MPIEPVKIPQNVYVEDRIIGPITLRQIMMVMISAGTSYAIWAAMKASGPVNATQTTLAWIPTVIGVIFAFVKINGISLFRIVLLGIERIDKPAKRVFSPRQGVYVNIVTKIVKDEPTKGPTKSVPGKSTQIEELSRVLDQGPSEIPGTEGNLEGLMEEPAREAKPVNPGRIRVDEREKPIDDIAPSRSSGEYRQFGNGILRDISPPPSHA